MDFSKHTFRASQFGNLMTGTQGLTIAQDRDLLKLQQKELEGKKLTTIQQKKVKELIHKRDNIELSKGAKSYLRQLRRELKFKRRSEIKSKYLTKGIELEEQAITFLSIWHDDVFTNNKERVFTEFFQGECDVPEGYDTKCSWDLNSLPDPEEALPSIYEYQNRVYMILHDADRWTTSSILLNMTDSALADAIYREGFRWKDNNIPEWRKLEIINLHIYDEKNFYRLCQLHECTPTKESEEKAIDIFTNFVEIPMHERIVEKTTYRDNGIEETMIEVARLARIYLQEQEDLANEREK